MKPNTEAAFWAKVWKAGDCWRWLGRGKKFSYDGRQEYANRLAWILINGPIPAGKQIFQQCESRFCINPAHYAPPGTVNEMMITKFWSRVNKQGRIVNRQLGRCWEWTGGGQAKDGYGTMFWIDRVQLTHRIAWFLIHNEFPRFCLLHQCDNRRCVREGHLFEGTVGDNNRDRADKGRGPRGSKHLSAKLSEEDVIAICKLYRRGQSLKELANQFGVSPKTVWSIIDGKIWKHLGLRIPPSERPRRPKLSAEKVREIMKLRTAGMDVPTIAACFKVNKTMIYYVLAGHSWKHVTNL